MDELIETLGQMAALATMGALFALGLQLLKAAMGAS